MLLPLLIFAVATAVSLGMGHVMRRFAPVAGTVVRPQADRWHNHPTPTMGGIGIVLAVIVAFSFTFLVGESTQAAEVWLPVILAALAMFAVGVLDDRLQLSPLAKLVSSLIAGAFLVFALGGSSLGSLSFVETLVAIVWFAGVCHALNLLDNMDGLATGVALLAVPFVVGLSSSVLGWPLMMWLVATAGALLGFLYWNRHRARLFMGDCGSLFLGATLAGTTLVPVFEVGDTLSQASLMALLVLVVPLFDTAFVLVLRRLAGRPATRGGTDHVSHRLVSLGFSERSAVRILYLLGLLGGSVAWGVHAGSQDVMLPVVALFAAGVTLLGVYLARVAPYGAGEFGALDTSPLAPLIKDLTFRWHAGEVMLDLVLISASYYFAYWLRFPDEQLTHFLPFFGASLPAVVGLKLASLYASGLYRRSWETFGLRDITAVLRGVGLGSLLSVLVAAYFYRMEGYSRVVFALDALLLVVAIVSTRSFFRSMNLVASARSKRSRRVLVYGAGSFGQLLVREMRANPDWQMNPVVFIDDDPSKWNRFIDGVPVRGAAGELESVLAQNGIDEVVLSSPAINGSVEQHVREVGARLGTPVKRLHIDIR